MNKHQYVVIMAGGIGTRFWPKSRTNFPKQFLDILNIGKTLIQSTFDRFSSFIPLENIYVVTSGEYVNIVKKQLPELPLQNILAEPSRKNTAPCIAYISFKLNKLDPNALLIVAPADHLISDNIAFKKVCLEALSFTQKHNAIITLGIKPTYPNTGYGYIQYEQQPVSDNVFKVKTFTEKPNLELAKTFLASGEFLWNAGIFVWQVKNIITAFEKHLQIYPFSASVSIDVGIMEKADNVYVIPSSFGWSDLGTWNSAYENLQKDIHANAVSSHNAMLIDTTNSIVHAKDNKLIVIQGLTDYIVVDTDDVLLICRKDKEQEIKEYVGDVKRHKGEKYL